MDLGVRRLWVRVRRRWLDWLIAHGVDPSASRSLALRSRQLTSPEVRHTLAGSIERILHATPRQRHWSATVQPHHESVEAARAALHEISEMLRDQLPVYARGVAMTVALLRGTESPLFDARDTDSAWYWANATVRALQGHI